MPIRYALAQSHRSFVLQFSRFAGPVQTLLCSQALLLAYRPQAYRFTWTLRSPQFALVASRTSLSKAICAYICRPAYRKQRKPDQLSSVSSCPTQYLNCHYGIIVPLPVYNVIWALMWDNCDVKSGTCCVPSWSVFVHFESEV